MTKRLHSQQALSKKKVDQRRMQCLVDAVPQFVGVANSGQGVEVAPRMLKRQDGSSTPDDITLPVGSHPDEEDVGNAELDDIMDEDYDEDPMGFRDYDLDDR